MPLSSVAAFWAVSMVFILTPGADWAYAITAGVRNRSALPAIGGMLSGHLVATVVVAAGLGLLLTGNPTILAALTIVGAAYIVWLGVGMVRTLGDGVDVGAVDPAADHSASDHPAAGSRGDQFMRGVGVSLLNPKVILLLGALLPPFAAPDAALPVPAQMMVLGTVHVVGCAVVYVSVGLLAARFLGGRPAAARVVTRVSGVMLVAVGAVLLARQVTGLL